MNWKQKIEAQIWSKTGPSRELAQALLDVAVAAAKCHPHMCGKVFDPMRVEEFEKAYDKLREVGDG